MWILKIRYREGATNDHGEIGYLQGRGCFTYDPKAAYKFSNEEDARTAANIIEWHTPHMATQIKA